MTTASSAFEENEISEKSQGGTEQCKRSIAAKLPAELNEHFQVICSRVREIKNDKIRIYWLHDLPTDPETNHIKDESSRNRFHKIVFCGNWQYEQYVNMLGLSINDKLAVIDTPIVPFPEVVKKFDDKIRLIYTSTPQRGLQLLVPVFQKLAEKYPNIHLDVFSSFKIYGWDDADKQFEPIYKACREHPQITYHGFSPNDVVRDHLMKAHIFAYPSIWPECNSRALIESMSAGLLCVHPNLAGLQDTAGNLTAMYQFNQDLSEHASKFYAVLDRAIELVSQEQTQQYLGFVKAYADFRFSIDRIAAQWQDLMEGLLKEFPTADTRAVPPPMFKYKANF